MSSHSSIKHHGTHNRGHKGLHYDHKSKTQLPQVKKNAVNAERSKIAHNHKHTTETKPAIAPEPDSAAAQLLCDGGTRKGELPQPSAPKSHTEKPTLTFSSLPKDARILNNAQRAERVCKSLTALQT